MEINKDVKEVLLSKEEIDKRVEELGEEIGASYRNLDRDLVFVGVLKGASVFMADLIRKVDRPLMIDFMSVSSYGMGSESSGEVKILKDITTDVKGKDVLLVEDIIDTGLTLAKLSEIMKDRGCHSVKIVSLLSKDVSRVKDVEIDFKGFDIPDEFIVGYGIDYAEKYRNLEYIASLKEDLYS